MLSHSNLHDRVLNVDLLARHIFVHVFAGYLELSYKPSEMHLGRLHTLFLQYLHKQHNLLAQVVNTIHHPKK
jgi:hypothetical protein